MHQQWWQTCTLVGKHIACHLSVLSIQQYQIYLYIQLICNSFSSWVLVPKVCANKELWSLAMLSAKHFLPFHTFCSSQKFWLCTRDKGIKRSSICKLSIRKMQDLQLTRSLGDRIIAPTQNICLDIFSCEHNLCHGCNSIQVGRRNCTAVLYSKSLG